MGLHARDRRLAPPFPAFSDRPSANLNSHRQFHIQMHATTASINRGIAHLMSTPCSHCQIAPEASSKSDGDIVVPFSGGQCPISRFAPISSTRASTLKTQATQLATLVASVWTRESRATSQVTKTPQSQTGQFQERCAAHDGQFYETGRT
jgi:hypothetical protein